jgi:hypothetical protein
MRKYAIIHHNLLTDGHISLIRATGMNTTRESIGVTIDSEGESFCIVEWEDTIAQQIPQAVIAIQEIIDAGVEIRDEANMRAYLLDPTSPFYTEPLGYSSSSTSSIDSSSSSSWRGTTSSSSLD